MRFARIAATVLSLGMLLAACGDDAGSKAPPPPPVASIPQDAVGHYCGMFLFEHKGPKGQILLRDREKPVWFTTIREVFAYTQLPEEPKTITGIYVQDMAKMTPEGDFPEPAWIDAREAWYVIRSNYAGGMGTQDALPFGTETAAHAFRQKHGGEVARFSDVPEDYIFGAGVNVPETPRTNTPAAGGAS